MNGDRMAMTAPAHGTPSTLAAAVAVADDPAQTGARRSGHVVSTSPSDLRVEWRALRDRLSAKDLLRSAAPWPGTSSIATLSLRIPGEQALWFGEATQAEPQRIEVDATLPLGHASAGPVAPRGLAPHLAVYAARLDVCAVLIGAGPFGAQWAAMGGVIPGVFDEQVRHLGRMPAPVHALRELAPSLAAGANVLLVEGGPMVLGMTPSRLALNAELFEKCVKAYLPAVASGGPVRPLPWWVRWVANGRLMKDEARARGEVGSGRMPVEAKGY